jgi:hypothetical protein
MSQRKWTIVVAGAIILVVAAELIGRSWSRSTGCVEIVNEGDSAIDDLVIRYADTAVTRPRLEVGKSTKAFFTAAGKGALSLDFKQKGNPLKGFQVDDFDPADNLRNAYKLVLVVKNNRVERYLDDDPAASSTNVFDRIRDWVATDLKSRP